MSGTLKKIILAANLVTMVYNICLASAPASADFESEISAASAIVLSDDGQSLFEKNADERRLIASTTKLMTALVAIENSSGEQIIEIDPVCCGIEGTSMYLLPGDHYTVDELLCGLLLSSGNDAAEALAVGLCGSEDAFVAKMNDKARALGLENTSYRNPHGLDAEGHCSTARDLARLMLACMQNERFAALCGKREACIHEANYVNHNKLLSTLPGCLAGKTGYTRAAGRCLVSCCERDGLRLVCVTLSDPDDWNDHSRLYEQAFAAWERRVAVSTSERYEIALVAGLQRCAVAAPERELSLVLRRCEELRYVRELPLFAYAPVRAGEYAGRIVVIRGDETIDEIPLIYCLSVEKESE